MPEINSAQLEKLDALNEFLADWRNALVHLPHGIAEVLTCREATALANLFRVACDDEAADAVLKAHSQLDKCDHQSESEGGGK